MATKPGTIPTWATNTLYSTGDYSGEPTKVDPSAARADGHLPNTAPLPEHENFDRNLIGQWIAFLADLHGSTDFLNKNYVWTGNHRFTSVSGVVAGGVNGGFRSLAGFFFSDANGTLDYRQGKVFVPVLNNENESGSFWIDAFPYRRITTCAGQTKFWYYRIPAGSRVSNVALGVSTTGTTGDTQLRVRRIVYDDVTPAAPSIGGFTTDTLAGGSTTDNLTVAAPTANAWQSLGSAVLQIELTAPAAGQLDIMHLRLQLDEAEVTALG